VRLVQESFAVSSCSLHGLASRSGMPVATVWRHLHHIHYPAVEAVERLLVALGCRLHCRDPAGRWHPLPLSRDEVAVVVAGGGGMPAPPATGLGGFLGAERLRWGVGLRLLQRASGLPYGTVRRSLADRRTGVVEQLLRLLGCLGCSLFVLTADGDQVGIPMPGVETTAGSARREAHLASLRRYRARHLLRMPRRHRRGRLRVSKDEVVARYQRQGQDCAQIALYAGVSADRVRQILKQRGVPLERDRQLAVRRAATPLMVLRPGS
jgi:hypothetical protein